MSKLKREAVATRGYQTLEGRGATIGEFGDDYVLIVFVRPALDEEKNGKRACVGVHVHRKRDKVITDIPLHRNTAQALYRTLANYFEKG